MARPIEWQYASHDLNVLLSGQPSNNDQSIKDSEQDFKFLLDSDGLYIEHPALVAVTTTPTSQTLSCINTGQPILTLEIPLLPASRDTSPSESPDQSRGISPSRPEPQLVTLHRAALVDKSQYDQLKSSPAYSTTFKILVDGPGFLPPRFDPSAIAPPTPQVGAVSHQASSHGQHQHNIFNSPALQRALLSPLLSPQRRAASQGSDISVPPLSLGISRARAPSLSGPSSGANQEPTTSGSSSSANSRRPSASNGPIGARSQSSSRPPRGLSSLNPALSPSTHATAASSPSINTITGTGGTAGGAGGSDSAVRPSLEAILGTAVSARAKQTAEDILALRRAHDTFVKRTKLELEVLQTRISDAAFMAATGGTGSGAGPSGLVVKGFGTQAHGQGLNGRGVNSENSSKSPSGLRRTGGGHADASGIGSREPSQERDPSEERGRSARPGPGLTARNSEKDETVSQQIREEDERQEEERGRSLSRTRRDSETGTGGRSVSKNKNGGATSSSRSRIKSVVQASKEREAAAATAATGASGSSLGNSDGANTTSTAVKTPLPASLSSAGQSIPASLDDSEQFDPVAATINKDVPPSGDRARTARGGHGSSAGEAVASPIFVPSSHMLVAIPESDELSLPPSESRTPEIAPSPKGKTGRSDEDSEEEHDTPFEMDEDIDVDDLALDSGRANGTVAAEAEFEEGTAPKQSVAHSPATSRTASTSALPMSSSSYRRPSTLSASYATLLSTSASRNSAMSMMQQAAAASTGSYRPPTMASFKAPPPLFAERLRHGSSPSGIRGDSQRSGDDRSLARSPYDSPHGTSTSVQEDARANLAYVPAPDPRAARLGENKIRQVLAMDAPSHRSVLPSRQRRRTSGQNRSDDDSDEEEDDDGYGNVGDILGSTSTGRGTSVPPPPPSRFAVGSLPISIGMARPAASNFRPAPERELERKTSVPSREGMFVPPLLLRNKSSSSSASNVAKKSVRVVEPTETRDGRGRGDAAASASSDKLALLGGDGPVEIGEKKHVGLPAVETGGPTGRKSAVGDGAVVSSLAQSLRQNTGQRSFATQVLREEEQDGVIESLPATSGATQRGAQTAQSEDGDGAVGDEDDEEEGEDEFVPPHEFVRRRGRSDEEMLSRSVGSES